ncbi:50S ribosomal protein L10 [Candidatus Kuenenbacteria bacterium CG_4_9_14_3_um_filter_39_14]|uniref:Large ribosomal subunit protein uL10 n=7 Tax=Candidatus Kueneniibacteriota TaxID=1752740 RepID=A0A2M7IL73_9BACT|nr:50S ribosomal protein L10 [Candidatus Kuenenbacteria bacterium]OIP56340.1 MAG: 50S ribosomal protein L10 [Candidatus Kuenenbacteria bacterium CG2_30_39_24]PIP28842.1 MAG: 50S ribosomal protein L10 [Candidatus Kuenenbacteria bacterium CG23_combo_of_CG06-09_8_20_14_all_39_39]PIP75592.1 MAG: 50S ribosomal protein L10 [Candidatus Kuenenbacteria bacterium CG22_combo_CG10-13_8_21_14_all_39_9]PIR80459.1 MAG: 50S ribosomal protein L10 [Candidatus Kuenenbacteria bacterium CG10_big_fil_rev_8_21_14_0_1
MPKTRQQKETVLSNLTDNIKNAKSATLASFSAITVKDDQQLRNTMHQENVNYSVIKKTLLRKAFEKLGFKTDLFKGINGNVAMAISAADEVAPAKAIHDFAVKNNNMNIVGGILENNWIDSHKVKALAVLPSKQELLAKVVGTIKAPLSGLVNVLAGNMRGLVNVLKAIKDQKS